MRINEKVWMDRGGGGRINTTCVVCTSTTEQTTTTSLDDRDIDMAWWMVVVLLRCHNHCSASVVWWVVVRWWRCNHHCRWLVMVVMVVVRLRCYDHGCLVRGLRLRCNIDRGSRWCRLRIGHGTRWWWVATARRRGVVGRRSRGAGRCLTRWRRRVRYHGGGGLWRRDLVDHGAARRFGDGKEVGVGQVVVVGTHKCSSADATMATDAPERNITKLGT
jgi:hypothetical protein